MPVIDTSMPAGSASGSSATSTGPRSFNIQIFDGTRSNSAVIGAGSRVPVKAMTAFQIQGWVESQLVIQGSNTIVAAGFNVGGGDSLFDTGSLFCFDGPMSTTADNVVMVLWGFPAKPQSGDSGEGLLNAPPASGVLAGGSISWQVV
jgi:hypothetical protein